MTRRTSVQQPAQQRPSIVGTLLSLLGFTMLAMVGCGDAAPTCDCPGTQSAAFGEAPPPPMVASARPSIGDEDAKTYVLTPTTPVAAFPGSPPAPDTKTAAKPATVATSALVRTAKAATASSHQPAAAKTAAARLTTKGKVKLLKPRAVSAKKPGNGLATFDVEGDFGITAAAIATGMEQRLPTGINTTFTTDTLKLWAFIKVRNQGEPTTVTMVWNKDGKKVWSYDLRVGKSAGWRTWSRKSVRKRDVGNWSVDILDADGQHLQTLAFKIEAGEEVATL